MYSIDFIPLCRVSGCQPRSLQELGVSSILKICCPGCSSASCSPLSAPSMDQRGRGEWLWCSSLHRANATYALAQSLRFFCLGEEASNNDTLHTVKGKCHGIFLSSAHCKTLWGFLKAQTGFSLILYTTWSNYSCLFDFQASKLTKSDWIHSVQWFYPVKTVVKIRNETIYAFNTMWMSVQFISETALINKHKSIFPHLKAI